jgi:hypothetical protein
VAYVQDGGNVPKPHQKGRNDRSVEVPFLHQYYLRAIYGEQHSVVNPSRRKSRRCKAAVVPTPRDMSRRLAPVAVAGYVFGPQVAKTQVLQ